MTLKVTPKNSTLSRLREKNLFFRIFTGDESQSISEIKENLWKF